MKTAKNLLVFSLAALTFGLTACQKTEPHSIEFGDGYRCENRLKEAELRLYKDDLLIGKKIPYKSKVVYELFNKGEKFTEREIISELTKGEKLLEEKYQRDF